MIIKCSKCGIKHKKRFRHGRICLQCSNERQREIRSKDGNAWTKKYEKTKRGFIMRMYRNMKSRIDGVQNKKFHLYEGKELLPKQVFYDWILEQETFHKLFQDWEISGYERKLTPSVDRINSSEGYHFSNMRIVTFSENCANIRK